MANKIDLWRYKDKIYLGTTDYIELPNGNIIDNGADIVNDENFVSKYTFHCSQYRVSDRNINSINGIDEENTIVVALKHRPNFDYDMYRAKYKGKYYMITYIVPDTSAIVTYDLLSLKSVIKNGGSTTSSLSSGEGYSNDNE